MIKDYCPKCGERTDNYYEMGGEQKVGLCNRCVEVGAENADLADLINRSDWFD